MPRGASLAEKNSILPTILCLTKPPIKCEEGIKTHQTSNGSKLVFYVIVNQKLPENVLQETRKCISRVGKWDPGNKEPNRKEDK